MATTRLLRTSKPLTHAISSSSSSSSSSSALSAKTTVRCLGKAGFNEEKKVCGNGDHHSKSAAPMKASVATSDALMITSKPEVGQGIDLASLLGDVLAKALLKASRPVLERKTWKLIQMLIERVIIDCRFFTLFAVAGSLLGSVLCFLEGCFLILESYFQFFYSLSKKSDQAHMVHLIIEAIDVFLVGTAMLIFGVGLYAMFVGSKNKTEKHTLLPESNLFGLFYMKALPKWIEIESVSQAKSKIGHALMMFLQVGVLEKFDSVPLTTSMDLVCFAGAVIVSSACVFVLSKLSVGNTMEDG